jgi:hypothetical protein
MESINELKNGRDIEATPFYDIYTYLTSQDLTNPENIIRLSTIFKTSQTFDKTGIFTGVYEFIKEAAKVNNLALDQKLINKLILSKQIRKDRTFLDCRVHFSQDTRGNETESNEMSDDDQLENNKTLPISVGSKRKISDIEKLDNQLGSDNCEKTKELEYKRKRNNK